MKYPEKEFQDGEVVYHLSNASVRMVVIGRDESTNTVKCRWIDDSSKSNVEDFLSVELEKVPVRTKPRSFVASSSRINHW